MSGLQFINANNASFPQAGSSRRAGHFISMFDTTALAYGKTYNNCSNTLCYTQSKGTKIYQPHTSYGMVGTTAASYLGRRKRI